MSAPSCKTHPILPLPEGFAARVRSQVAADSDGDIDNLCKPPEHQKYNESTLLVLSRIARGLPYFAPLASWSIADLLVLLHPERLSSETHARRERDRKRHEAKKRLAKEPAQPLALIDKENAVAPLKKRQRPDADSGSLQPSGVQRIPCSLCSMSSTSHEGLKKHMQRHH